MENENPIRICNVPIKSLTLLERNPRRISKTQMDKLCKSLKDDADFLFNRPILVHELDGVFYVYCGNQRVRAAKQLRWKEIPCIIERNLSEEIIKARIIKDNKTYGEFDYDILASDYETSDLLDYGFNENEIPDISKMMQEDPEDLDQDKEKDKKKKKCPHCQGEL